MADSKAYAKGGDIMGNAGRIVRATRKANGLTQKELASAMTVTQPYISQIERGTQTPAPMFIKLFCLLYCVAEESFA